MKIFLVIIDKLLITFLYGLCVFAAFFPFLLSASSEARDTTWRRCDGVAMGGSVHDIQRVWASRGVRMDPQANAHAEVADGQNVGAVEREDEEHLGGPAADAFDGSQAFDDFFVVSRPIRAKGTAFERTASARLST